MGQPANFVIIESGKARAFYDQWAALASTYEFAEGPEHATRSAKAGESTEGLLDWALAEAGYLIDHDQKVAIVFGYPRVDLDSEDFEGPEEIDPKELEGAREIHDSLVKGLEHSLEHIARVWVG